MINSIQFKLHRRFFGDKVIDRGMLDYIYNNYVDYNNRLKINQPVSEETYKSVISEIYSALSLRVSDSEFLFIVDRFTKLMIIDQLNGNVVDINWIIDHIWYLVEGTKDSYINNIKYRQSLKIIRDNLLEKFDIKVKKIN